MNSVREFDFENMNAISCVAFLFLLGEGAFVAAANTGEHTPVVQRPSINDRVQARSQSHKLLSILLVPRVDPGHLIPMSTLGEALVRRGHNVTLCTTEREGDDLPQQLAERTGMTWLSAGPDNLPMVSIRRQSYARRQGMHVLATGLKTTHDNAVNGRRIFDALMSNYSATSWNIVIADLSYAVQIACLSMNHNIPMVLLQISLDASPSNKPHWSYPEIITMFTDNMTFSQRLVSLLISFGAKYFHSYATAVNLQTVLSSCKQDHHELYQVREGCVPTIISTAIGFEYPRPILPMSHYVGPLVLKTEQTIPDDMIIWLEKQTVGSVVYISMGSGVQLSKDQGRALANGALQTNYNVLWSLRACNRDILEGLSLDKQRVFISEWTPQRAVLCNKAIALAVLHGGMGGVGEAICNAVPLVVVPFVFDQFSIAARVQHAGAGVYLDRNTLTANEVKVAIETVSSPSYKHAARKLQKIFQHAGGPERAAELVEYYEDVGYEHLVPAYLKYQWNWVQYYNVDVYTLIAVVIVTPALAAFMLCRYCFCNRKVKVN